MRPRHAASFVKALEGGINFFDTANAYSSGAAKKSVGGALKEFSRREEVLIATKVYGRMRPGQTAPAYPADQSWVKSMPA
jgi:aryl-alcohol dehydrogenase-like predicted oxidoreductase